MCCMVGRLCPRQGLLLEWIEPFLQLYFTRTLSSLQGANAVHHSLPLSPSLHFEHALRNSRSFALYMDFPKHDCHVVLTP